MSITRAEAAQARAAAYFDQHPHENQRRSAMPGGIGAQRVMSNPAGEAGSDMEHRLVTRDGKQWFRTQGYATVYNRSYEMWDFFGPYDEKVDGHAGDVTIAANPDVVFLINHRGLTLARTVSGSLELNNDAVGLHHVAYMNPQRSEVTDLMMAMDDRLVTEMSFAFMIERGEWNDDFTEFTIMEYNIDRGDVSAVNYGANPFTSIAARQRELLRELSMVPAAIASAAYDQLGAREDLRKLAQRSGRVPAQRSEPLVDLDALRESVEPQAAPEPPPAPKPSVDHSIAHIQTLIDLREASDAV